MTQVEEWLRAECGAFPNVSFLQKTAVDLPEENCVVLGCTLWTEVMSLVAGQATQLMNDYRSIYLDGGKPASVADLNAVHADHFAWLQSTVSEARAARPGARIVVLTHHLPSFRMIAQRFEGNELNSCFASGALEKIAVKPTCWLFGHSHIREYKILDGVCCGINSFGYMGEQPVGGNAVSAVVDLAAGQVEGLVAGFVPRLAVQAVEGAGRKRPRPMMEEEEEEVEFA
jgi:hypothetical protein